MGCCSRLLLPLLLAVIVLVASLTETTGQTVLADTSNVSDATTQSDPTVRIDPLDGFKKYRGGYDITNKHYWSSTLFTGVYGYAIALFWLLCGLVYGGGFLERASFCSKRNEKKPKTNSPCRKQCYLWPILLAVFFTLLAITASALVLGGSTRFHSQADTVVSIVMRTADQASNAIYNTTGAMKEMKDKLGETNANAKASGFLNRTSEKLDVEAARIEMQARKHRRLIDKGLKIVYVVTMVTISLNLVAAIALSVIGILKLQRALPILIAICWFFTVLCWLFFGQYLFLEAFSSDTCTSLENFRENPYNNTLSAILPCDELLAAKPVLSDVSEGIYNLVDKVNANISVLRSSKYPYLAYVCNPFSAPPEYLYQPDNCPANTIKIGDIPKVLAVFTCSDDNGGTCKNGEFISSHNYKIVEAYTSSIQRLLNAYPGMESLVECKSVEEAFSEIVHKHCKPLKRFAKMSWAAMLFLAIVMVVLVLIWTAQARHEQLLHSWDGSVKPHSTSENDLESKKTDELAENHSKPSLV